MRGRAAGVLGLLLALTGAAHAAEDQALEGREATTTAKERLVNKAADTQRVDDCKVPEAKRDADRARPADCRHLRGKEDGNTLGPDG
jgi:hypothetical protein